MCHLYNFTMGSIVNTGKCASKLDIVYAIVTIIIPKRTNLYNKIPTVSAPISSIIEIQIPAPVICDILFTILFGL